MVNNWDFYPEKLSTIIEFMQCVFYRDSETKSAERFKGHLKRGE
jgi:hypothetical protein